jgi:hypothetical protein
MRPRPAALAAFTALLVLVPHSSNAHDASFGTSVTRFKVPGGPSHRGDRIVLMGRLRSADASCQSGLIVELYRDDPAGDHLLAKDQTDANGQYVFERRPRRDQTVHVGFLGLTQTDAAHAHICGASTSKPIHVRIETSSG